MTKFGGALTNSSGAEKLFAWPRRGGRRDWRREVGQERGNVIWLGEAMDKGCCVDWSSAGRRRGFRVSGGWNSCQTRSRIRLGNRSGSAGDGKDRRAREMNRWEVGIVNEESNFGVCLLERSVVERGREFGWMTGREGCGVGEGGRWQGRGKGNYWVCSGN